MHCPRRRKQPLGNSEGTILKLHCASHFVTPQCARPLARFIWSSLGKFVAAVAKKVSGKEFIYPSDDCIIYLRRMEDYRWGKRNRSLLY